jgi:hypothetical protein
MTTAPGGGMSPPEGPQPGEKTPVEAANILASPPAPEPAAAPSGKLSADEELQLAELQARARAQSAGEDTVRLKVEEPHSAMVHGGITIGREFTDVPAFMSGPLFEAAANAGVKLTQES